MRNAELDEAQAGIKIAGRNINNLRYTDDTTLLAENEELKSLMMKVKEESKRAGLKLNIQKAKIKVSCPITSWQIDGETMEIVRDFIFHGCKNHLQWFWSPLPEKKSLTISIVSPSIWHEVMWPDAMILAFWMLELYYTEILGLGIY